MGNFFVISDVDEAILWDEQHPFAVLVSNHQPVGLFAQNPIFKKRQNKIGDHKTAVILAIPDGVSWDDNLISAAAFAVDQEIEAEGVIVVNIQGDVVKVVPADELLSKFAGSNFRFGEFGTIRPTSEIDIPVTVIYTCPQKGCKELDWYLLHKGMEVPYCPKHNVPRILRKTATTKKR